MDIVTLVTNFYFNQLKFDHVGGPIYRSTILENALEDEEILEQDLKQISKEQFRLFDEELLEKVVELVISELYAKLGAMKRFELVVKDNATDDEVMQVIRDFDSGVQPKGVNPERYSQELFNFLRKK